MSMPRFSLRKKFKRLPRKTRYTFVGVICLSVCSLIAYTYYMQNKRLTADPQSYQPLLEVIARAESSGNYNAYFGNAANASIDFTNMTIAQVMKWQADYVAGGSPSNAVGRYQIISTTLAGVVNELGIDTSQKFDSATQDRMAAALIERRGSEAYVNQELTRDQFAANIAKEWAGLPKVVGDNPGDSYYASDGLNKARVSVEDVLKAVDPISAKK